MARYTPAQAAAALARFETGLPKAIAGLALQGMRPIHKAAIREHMIPGGGKHAPVHPIKLTWRSGDLARTVAIIPPRVSPGWRVTTGLRAGNASVRYAGHEYGIRGIRARPYMGPAIRNGFDRLRLFIQAGVGAFAEKAI